MTMGIGRAMVTISQLTEEAMIIANTLVTLAMGPTATIRAQRTAHMATLLIQATGTGTVTLQLPTELLITDQ